MKKLKNRQVRAMSKCFGQPLHLFLCRMHSMLTRCESQVVQLGFAILPVIGPAGNYVLSGNYRLPLYAMGAKPKPIELDQADQLKERSFGPSPKVLERLQVLDSRKHIQDALDQCVQEHEIHLVPGTSVVCRLVDRFALRFKRLLCC
jgi:hypothetical protein